MAEDLIALALEKASADPALKPQFAQALMTSTVFVLGEVKGEYPVGDFRNPSRIDRDVIVQSQLGPDGKTTVPFFSSLEKMQRFISEEAKYVTMPTRALFELAKGSTLVLNPGSPVSVRITPENAANILRETSDLNDV